MDYDDDQIKFLSTPTLVPDDKKHIIFDFYQHFVNNRNHLNAQTIKFFTIAIFHNLDSLEQAFKQFCLVHREVSVDLWSEIKRTYIQIYHSAGVQEIFQRAFGSYDYVINFFNLFNREFIVRPSRNNSRLKTQDGYFVFETYFPDVFVDVTHREFMKEISKDVRSRFLEPTYGL